MDLIIIEYFIEIYERKPTPEELEIFRAGFYAGYERKEMEDM